MGDIRLVKEAVERAWGCNARHVESVPVKETFKGQIVWDGVVEVFDLDGCPMAKRSYAWAFTDDEGKAQYRVVLEKPPVDGPRKAVQVAIAKEAKGE